MTFVMQFQRDYVTTETICQRYFNIISFNSASILFSLRYHAFSEEILYIVSAQISMKLVKSEPAHN